MAITADYQGEIRTLTFGVGTAWEIARAQVSGIGVPGVRDRSQDRGDRHGAVAAADLLDPRTIGIPFIIRGTSAAHVTGLLNTLTSAWRPAAADITLDLRLPGLKATVLRSYGRPRGVSVDLTGQVLSHIKARAEFEALDPLLYGAPVVTGPSSGTVNVTNAGDMATDRATIVVTGNGGTPRIVNPADRDGEIRWGQPLGNGVTRTVDLRARAVTGSGGDRFTELSPLSDWFALEPGVNGLVLTGAASITVTHRPGFI